MQWLVIGVSGVTCGGKTTLAHSLRDYFQAHRHMQLWQTPCIIGDVQLISQDDYFLPVTDLRHIWDDKLNAINFELLTALDMKQMLSDITWTMKGRYLAGLDNIEYMNDVAMSTNFEQYAPPLHAYQNHHHYIQLHHPHQNSQHSVHHMNHQRHSNATTAPSTASAMRVSSQMIAQLCDNKINILIIEGFIILNQPELMTLCNIKFHFHLPYEKCYERRRKRTYDPPDVTGYFEICVWPEYEKNFAQYRDRKDITFLNGEISKDRILKFVLQKIVSYIEDRLLASISGPPPQKSGSNVNCIDSDTNHPVKTCPMEQL